MIATTTGPSSRFALPRERLTGRILLVGNDPQSRSRIKHVLEGRGHRVIDVDETQEALRCAKQSLPELVLLDLAPERRGLEVCTHLKADPTTSEIPVFLVTSEQAEELRVQGMRAGVRDLITRPVDGADLLHRVRHAIHSARLLQRLEAEYNGLRALQSARETLAEMAMHDLRTPLAALAGRLQVLQQDEGIRSDPERSRHVKEALDLVFGLAELASSLLAVSRLESGTMPVVVSRVDLREPIAEALRVFGLVTQPGLVYDPAPEPVWVYCDRELVRRVVVNLVDNALRVTAEGEVAVGVRAQGAWACVAVSDSGPGIAEESLGSIFDRTLRPDVGGVQRSTGLGLPFCKLAIEAQGGAIGVHSVKGIGSTFWLRLPLAARNLPEPDAGDDGGRRMRGASVLTGLVGAALP